MFHSHYSMLRLTTAALCAIAASSAAEPVAAEEHATFVALSQDLTAADWTVRDAAADRLVAMGGEVLPDVERALRLDQLTRTFNEQTAQLHAVAERLRQRSLVSGSFIWPDTTDTATLITSLTQPRGMTLELGAQLDDVAESVAPGTFWQVMTELCRTNGWDVSVDAGGSRNLRMAIVKAPAVRRQLAGPVCLTGPAAVVVREVRHVRRADFATVPPVVDDQAAASQAHELRCELEALFEPRYMIGPRDFDVSWSRVTTSDGISLLPGELEPGTAAVADAQGLADLPDATAAVLHTDATWSAGRLRLGVDLETDLLTTTDAEDQTLTLVGRIQGPVGADLYEAAVANEQSVEWVLAGEPVRVRLTRTSDAKTSTGLRSRWLLTATTRPRLDEPTRKLIAAALSGATATTQGARLYRGASRVRLDDRAVPSMEIEFYGRRVMEPDLPVRVTCEVPRQIVWLDLPFRFDGLPLP
jgi:hypothetical protein